MAPEFLRFGFVWITLVTLATGASGQSAPQLPPVLLQLIRDDAVHDELQASDDQRESILEALAEIDGRWFRARHLSGEEERSEIETLTREIQQRLTQILDASQVTRLEQLQRQALGTRMVLRDDVAQALKLSKDQIQTFANAFIDTDTKSAQVEKQLQQEDKSGSEAQAEIERIKNDERRTLISKLTADQRAGIGSLTGSPFNFSMIKRRLPLAPELQTEGVSWIQGGPLSLEQLKGKVVAVHFYAFQCINCQRNLPHYKGWHEDYADKGLVIIGIQTPETQSERQLDRVDAAAKSEGIEYPVMLDSAASNWRAWGNRVWPTVYLVDKKGFVRTWWQGEMNWKATPGEQKMRQNIETLLAE
jgi:thiol-disulfide isomerase/thioredoxin